MLPRPRAAAIHHRQRMDPKRWRLDGQLALVTGGSAGIGRAVARELLGFGADVLLAARDAAALESTRAELLEDFPEREVQAFVADVADDEQRRELLDWVEDFGEGLHILVNNAGGNVNKPTHRLQPKTSGGRCSRSTCSPRSNCRATRTRC